MINKQNLIVPYKDRFKSYQALWDVGFSALSGLYFHLARIKASQRANSKMVWCEGYLAASTKAWGGSAW